MPEPINLVTGLPRLEGEGGERVGRRPEVVIKASSYMTAKQNSEDLYTSAQP